MNRLAAATLAAAAVTPFSPIAPPTKETGTYTLRLFGDEILHTPCLRVAAPSDVPTQLLVAMRSVLDRERGLGISAPQLGVALRVCLVRVGVDGGTRLLELLNPSVVERSPETASEPEGCLSIPGFFTPIERARTVTVSYVDLTGRTRTIALAGLGARIVQHEIDHLDGRLIVDGVSRQQRRQAERLVAKARERRR